MAAKHEFTESQRDAIDIHGLRNKSGFPQLWRGYQALRGEYRNKALKTAAFAELLKDESSMAVCVDSHICWAALGAWSTGGTVAFADSAYATMAGWIAEIAAEYGIMPHQAQAIIWTVRKRLMKSDMESPGWVDAWIECKYSEHVKYVEESNIMPDYTIDLDVFKMYASKANLQWAMEQATPEDWHDGMTWYIAAHRDVRDAAHSTGVSVDAMAECVAALSPGRMWTYNVRAAQVLAEISAEW